MKIINPGLSPSKAPSSRDRVGSILRDRSLPTFSFVAIAIPILAALLLSPIGLRPALANEDLRDRQYVMEQVNQALETQKTKVETRWSNPETGNWGIIVIDRTFYGDTGEPCRNFLRTLDRPGEKPLVAQGTGCRIGPAQWEIEEKTPAPSEKPKPATTGMNKGTRDPAPEREENPTPTAAPTYTPTEKSTAAKAPVCRDPAAPAPPFTVVKAPCGRPPAFTDYTLPSKAEL